MPAQSVLGNQRSNGAVIVLQNTFLSQTLDNGIGSGAFPTQLLLTQLLPTPQP